MSSKIYPYYSETLSIFFPAQNEQKGSHFFLKQLGIIGPFLHTVLYENIKHSYIKIFLLLTTSKLPLNFVKRQVKANVNKCYISIRKLDIGISVKMR